MVPLASLQMGGAPRRPTPHRDANVTPYTSVGDAFYCSQMDTPKIQPQVRASELNQGPQK